MTLARLIWTGSLITGLCLGTSLPALAQGVSTNGLFGQRNIGSTVTAGQRTLTGAPGDRLSQQMQNAGEITGGERFLRDSRQPGQFVGSDSGDTRNFFGQDNAALGNALGLGPNRPGGGGLANVRGLANAAAQRPFRTTLRVRFRHPDIPVTQVRTKLEGSLQRLASSERFVGRLQMQMEGRTVVLQGVVATDEDRALAERLVALEAGVSAVRNELVVDPPPPEDWPLPSDDAVVPDSSR